MARRRSLAVRGIRAVTLAVAVALALYPVLWVIKIALNPAQTFSLSASPLPTTFSLTNFDAFISATDSQGRWLFGHQLFNSLVVSLATTLLGLMLASTAAYAFSRFRFPGARAGLAAFLVTQMFPGVMMAIPVYLLLDALGLLGSLVGLVLVYSITSIPFSVFMLKGYFDTIPIELENAARIDGCSAAGVFWRIVVPLSKPALAVTGLFSFMTAWNEFILAATFMNEEVGFTLPVALQRYVGDFATEWGIFAAGALLVSVPVAGIFFALQRYLVEGLTAGGVKG